jgi:hypothetical protein
MWTRYTKAAHHTGATRVVASTLGVTVGLAGVDHGIFEILQGDVAPSALMIEAIGPAQRFWEYGVEPALTIVPSFLVTGILAVLLGLLVTLWSLAFIGGKYGAGVFFLLAVALFLVGGGFAPIFTTVLATLTATRIGRPLIWWRRHVPGRLPTWMARTWLGVLVAFVVLFLISVEIAIFGWPLTSLVGADTTMVLLNASAYVMLGLMILSPLTALAHDAHVQAGKPVQAPFSTQTGGAK